MALNWKSRIYLLSLFIQINVFGQSPNFNISLSGTLPKNMYEINLTPIDEISALTNESYKIKADSLGNFKLLLSIKKPGYFNLGYNILYLIPNDSLNINISLEDPMLTQFKGKSAERQSFLKECPNPKSGSYLQGGLHINKDFNENIIFINRTAKNHEVRLKSLQNEDSTFVKLETARIKCDVINSIDKIRTYYLHKFDKETQTEVLDQKLESIAQPLIDSIAKQLIDSSYLALHIYQYILPIISDEIKQNKDHYKAIHEWRKAYKLSKELGVVIKTKDSTLIDSLVNRISHLDQKYRTPLLASYNDSKNLMENTVLDFTYNDIHGKQHKLSDHRGKIIYIDFWATWCVPCIEERPFFAKLASQYDNIIFLSLSIDKDFNKWKEYLSKQSNQNSNIVEGWTSDIPSAYQVLTIPRYILIGSDFKIKSFDAPKPASNDIAKEIRVSI